jgi:hypothetical protein
MAVMKGRGMEVLSEILSGIGQALLGGLLFIALLKLPLEPDFDLGPVHYVASLLMALGVSAIGIDRAGSAVDPIERPQITAHVQACAPDQDLFVRTQQCPDARYALTAQMIHLRAVKAIREAGGRM